MNPNDINNIQQIGFPVQQQHVYTVSEVLGQFGEQFIFKIELLIVSFFILTVFLQYYTTKLEKRQRNNEKWQEHIDNLNVCPIIESNHELSRNDKVLCFMSDALFLPSVAGVLTFVAYNTGWFT